MVATTRSRSRAAQIQMAEVTHTTFDSIPSPQKRTPKPKGTETPKIDGNRSRPRTRGPPGAKPRSASTKTPPRKPMADSVDTERRSESKSVSRKRATPTKKGGSTKVKNEDADEAVTKNNVKTNSRSQSKAMLKKEPVTKEKMVKVKSTAKKPPTQKRPRGQSQPKQVQKDTTIKKPKLEVNNPKVKNQPKEKPQGRGRAKRSASQAPPKKSWAAEACEPEDEPIAMRTRSRSGPVAPPPVKEAPAPRARRTRAKKAQPIQPVEVPISAEGPSAPGTQQNEPETETTGKDATPRTQPPIPEIKQEILPKDATGSSDDSKAVNVPARTAEPLNQTDQIPAAKGSNCNIRALRKANSSKVSTFSVPFPEDTFEVPMDSGPVPDQAIDVIVSALAQNADLEFPGRTLTSACFSILAEAGISFLRRGVPEGTRTQKRPVRPTSATSVFSSIETVRLGQIDSSEPRTGPVPAVEARLDSSLDPGHSTPGVVSEDLIVSLHIHVQTKTKQGAQRKSYTLLKFTAEQQEQLAAIFRECFNSSRE